MNTPNKNNVTSESFFDITFEELPKTYVHAVRTTLGAGMAQTVATALADRRRVLRVLKQLKEADLYETAASHPLWMRFWQAAAATGWSFTAMVADDLDRDFVETMMREGAKDSYCLIREIQMELTEEGVAERFSDAFSGLCEDGFLDEILMRTGREKSFLESSPQVEKMVRVLHSITDPEEVVENKLDELFEDLRTGEPFVHTESLMAFLVALSSANQSYFKKIAVEFAESKTAEMTKLRHFSRMLLEVERTHDDT